MVNAVWTSLRLSDSQAGQDQRTIPVMRRHGSVDLKPVPHRQHEDGSIESRLTLAFPPSWEGQAVRILQGEDYQTLRAYTSVSGHREPSLKDAPFKKKGKLSRRPSLPSLRLLPRSSRDNVGNNEKHPHGESRAKLRLRVIRSPASPNATAASLHAIFFAVRQAGSGARLLQRSSIA
jgi:hypothetical protein